MGLVLRLSPAPETPVPLAWYCEACGASLGAYAVGQDPGPCPTCALRDLLEEEDGEAMDDCPLCDRDPCAGHGTDPDRCAVSTRQRGDEEGPRCRRCEREG